MDEPKIKSELILVNGEKIAPWSWMVELTFSTAAGTLPNTINVPFSNAITGLLLGAKYFSIEAYSVATLAKAPSGYTVIPQATLTSSYITLANAGGQNFWNNKPLRDLQTTNDTASKAGRQYPEGLGGQKINWQNSGVAIWDTAALVASTNYSIPFVLNFWTDGKNPNS